MRNLTLLFWVFALLPFFAGAQSDTTQLDQVAMKFGLRYQSVDFSGFNSNAADLGYAPFEDRLYAIVGEFQFVQGRSVSALGFAWAEADNSNNSSTLNGSFYSQWEIVVRSEYNLLRHPDWILSPGFAFVGQWSRLGLSEQRAVGSLGQALNTQVQKITRFSTPVELGIYLQRNFSLGEEFSDLLVGLRGGYRFDFNDEEWKVDGTVPMADPGINIGGWFIELHFGLTGEYDSGRR